MKLKLLISFLVLGFFSAIAQTKVSGHVFDENNVPIFRKYNKSFGGEKRITGRYHGH